MNEKELQDILAQLKGCGVDAQLCNTPIPLSNNPVHCGLSADVGDVAIEDYVMLPKSLVGIYPEIFIPAIGDSMKDAGYEEGVEKRTPRSSWTECARKVSQAKRKMAAAQKLEDWPLKRGGECLRGPTYQIFNGECLRGPTYQIFNGECLRGPTYQAYIPTLTYNERTCGRSQSQSVHVGAAAPRPKLPSPFGEGLGVRPGRGWGGVK